METTEFEEFLQRYFNGKATPQEKTKFQAWLDIVDKDLLLTREQEKELFDKITARTTSDEEIIHFHQQIKRRSGKISLPFIAVAASILLIITLSIVIWSMSSGNMHEFTASATGEKVILEDGSIVWLTAGSTITLSDDFSSLVRTISLQGEGLFEIAKDPAHPFTISCGVNMVKVLGTSFTLKSEGDTVELVVLTGKVNLSSPSLRDGIDALPHDHIVFTKTGEVSRRVADEEHDIPLVERSSYDMNFVNEHMKNVIPRIMEKFDVKLSVSDNTMLTCRITADFTDLSLKDTMDLMTEVLEVSYTISKDVVKISGEGCEPIPIK